MVLIKCCTCSARRMKMLVSANSFNFQMSRARFLEDPSMAEAADSSDLEAWLRLKQIAVKGGLRDHVHAIMQDESAAFQEMLGAVLDGATPLHCAALRTSPKLTEHLLASGADPMATTAAGDLPMDLVPPCHPKPMSLRSKGDTASSLAKLLPMEVVAGVA